MSYFKSQIVMALKLFFLNKKWKKLNSHNNTWLERETNIKYLIVGKNSYGPLKVYNDTESCLKVKDYCSIADGVTFLLGIEHQLDKISTYPLKSMIAAELEATSKGNIIVDDDVWIGYGATIMSGVHIGQGAVVAAGAVVTSDVPPYAIVGGVPAKVIKYRFEPEMIEELLKIDYSKLSHEQIAQHIDDLYLELKDKRQLDWMPKKDRKNRMEIY